jgi:predicted dinucleotide-binding enzyme
MGWNVMADTAFGGLRADNYICGDDDAAKATVAALSRELGFEVVDAGPLASAVLLEGLARLWIDLALRRGLGREVAFKLLRR